jgi:hypothetical protein
MKFYENSHKEKYLFLILIFFGFLFRFYNINLDNFWIDEIFSFYIADPNVDFFETWHRNRSIENTPILFNLVLKYYFKFFGYEIPIARYFPALLNFLSILIIHKLFSKISNGKSTLLIVFLTCFNIYLIRYSQELRHYSLVFFLFAITIFYFLKIINLENQKFSIYKIFFFTFLNFLLLLTHVFVLTIFFAYFLFSLSMIVKYKKNLLNLNLSLILIFFISVIFLYFYVLNVAISPGWIKPFEFKFLTNLFFSSFFGSRSVGILFLVCLVTLIIYFRKKIILKQDIYFFLFLAILSSYSITIVYSVLISPVLIDRYLIFILLPILLIISNFSLEIKNKLLKNLIIFILVISTLGNSFTERSFKQFFGDKTIYKPDFLNLFKKINESEFNKFTYNFVEKSYFNKNELQKALKNYSFKYTKVNNKKLNYVNYLDKGFANKNIDFLWIVCLKSLNGTDCSLPNKFTNSSILNEYFFNGLNLKLIKIN